MASESRNVELTREHRSQSIETLLREGPAIFVVFTEATLLPPTVLDVAAPMEDVQTTLTTRPVDYVEGVLFRDPFVCAACGAKTATPAAFSPPRVATRVCPIDGRPHRRLLIEAASRLLTLVSEARASIVVSRPDPTPAIPASGSMTSLASPVTASPVAEAPAAGGAAEVAAGGPQFPAGAAVAAVPAAAAGRPKVLRPLPRKPHYLVLAFHAASSAGAVDDMHALAVALLAALAQICRAVCAEDRAAPNFTRRLQRQLIVFDRSWRSYVRLSEEGIRTAQQQAEHDAAAAAAATAAVTAVAPATSATADAALAPPTAVKQQQASAAAAPASDAGVSFFKPRPGAFAAAAAAAAAAATATATATATAALSRERTPPPVSDDRERDHDGSTSPEPAPTLLRPIAPPFSLRGASLSATDEESDSDRRGGGAAGATGAAPPLSAEEAQRLQQLQYAALLEQKRRGDEAAAREACAARVRMRQQNAFEDVHSRIEAVLQAVGDEVEGKVFLEELQARPPRMGRIPVLLRRITESLVGVVPSARVRQQLSRELQDVLDWDTLKHASADSVARVMRYVVGKVIELGAPAREEGLRAELDALVRRLAAEEPGPVVVDAIGFLRRAVRVLGDDILQAQLALVRPELAKRAVALQRTYLSEWTAPPPGWLPSTKLWVRKFVLAPPPPTQGAAAEEAGVGADASAADTPDAASAVPAACTPPGSPARPSHGLVAAADGAIDWSALKLRIATGVVDLLRSSGRSVAAGATRWSEYPTELLYFEKPVLFTSANTVQLLVVRMMIVGTVRAIFKGKPYVPDHVSPAQVKAFEVRLDRQLVEWLTAKERMTIAQLKDAVEAEVQFFLASNSVVQRERDAAASAAASAAAAAAAATGATGATGATAEPEQVMLARPYVVALRGVMDKMVDVNADAYTTFERKVLGAVTALLHKELALRHRTRGATCSAEAEHVADNADVLNALGGNIAPLVSKLVLDLADALDHHMAVYAPLYETILRSADTF